MVRQLKFIVVMIVAVSGWLASGGCSRADRYYYIGAIGQNGVTEHLVDKAMRDARVPYMADLHHGVEGIIVPVQYALKARHALHDDAMAHHYMIYR